MIKREVVLEKLEDLFEKMFSAFEFNGKINTLTPIEFTIINKFNDESCVMYAVLPSSINARMLVSEEKDSLWYFGSYGVRGEQRGMYRFDSSVPEWMLLEEGYSKECGFLMFDDKNE